MSSGGMPVNSDLSGMGTLFQDLCIHCLSGIELAIAYQIYRYCHAYAYAYFLCCLGVILLYAVGPWVIYGIKKWRG